MINSVQVIFSGVCMKLKFFSRVLVTLTLLGFLQGCLSGSRPISPAKSLSLTVSVVPPRGVGASFLGSSQNEILYRVDGTGVTVSGTAGPLPPGPAPRLLFFSLPPLPPRHNLPFRPPFVAPPTH